ncbi:MAG: hydrogenase iron-sulfur subunit [Thermodesulfobacteriota bacterium]|nr:hydrogenase iron-sulfur subunit [Thermodesulfobacteriota bacterium]
MIEEKLKIIVRGCHNLVPYREIVEAGASEFPPGVEAGLLPCSSKIEAHQILKFFEQGADGALILACPLGACRFVEGNRRAGKRAVWAAKWLEELGMEPARIKFLMVEPELARDITGIVKDFYAAVTGFGPTPVKGRKSGGGI